MLKIRRAIAPENSLSHIWDEIQSFCPISHMWEWPIYGTKFDVLVFVPYMGIHTKRSAICALR